jgi:hypothetical protein
MELLQFFLRLASGNRFVRLCRFALCSALLCSNVFALDLRKAIIVTPSNLSKPELKAVSMLIDEVEKRTQIRWAVASALPTNGAPVVFLGRYAALKETAKHFADVLSGDNSAVAEGYQIRVDSNSRQPAVIIAGNDNRGVLFGVGDLLRHLRMLKGEISIEDDYKITTSPRYPLRGHQLGYRPKTHSYDAWDIHTWEQYYRDLIVFGANAIELIPPRSDDDADSPHFPKPPLEMMSDMSRLADDYGLDVWVWYPAMHKDYSDEKTVRFALDEWNEVFKKVPRIDAVFVPGGDPGHTRPKYLMALLRKQSESLHQSHPKAQIWVSPQSFDREWFEEFITILKTEKPGWLSGVVFGPQVRVSLPELRAAVPKEYPIRHYPDITHTRQCEYPIPDWDVAFAITEGRECINPRPVDQAAIFRLLQPYTIGFLTYSEGCNDDVNKAVWSALGWDPEQDVANILREFSGYFIGTNFRESFAQGVLALERNWRGSLLANESVYTTLLQFQQMEKSATPQQLLNWRFQQALFRAYYDAYTRSRLMYESGLEEAAMSKLRLALVRGSNPAMKEAEALLETAVTEHVSPDWRARIFELAEALFQSIRMQLSVPRYKAIGVDRGASLDTVDYPLNNRPWLKEQFASIRQMPSEEARLQAIERILNWTNPGPGGFYDDLGNIAFQPHLVRGLPFADDPASLRSSKVGFEEGDVPDEPDEKVEGALRKSWIDHAESLVDQPLKLHYSGLDSAARYRIRVVYGGDSPKKKIRLLANDSIVIHPPIEKPFPFRPLEFDIPAAATHSGELTLIWDRESGLGGNGRGCQVSEIWLIKK